MAKKSKDQTGKGAKGLGADDFRLWKDFTRDIEPLEEPDWEGMEQAVQPQEAPRGETVSASVENIQHKKPVEAASSIQPAQLDARTEARLRRGQMPIEGRLDLHGCTQDEAHRRLNEFVINAQAHGKRCVLVITGKGLSRGRSEEGAGGVLRQKLPLWISMPPLCGLVLKTYAATQRDGGTGAWYLYLKRSRDY